MAVLSDGLASGTVERVLATSAFLISEPATAPPSMVGFRGAQLDVSGPARARFAVFALPETQLEIAAATLGSDPSAVTEEDGADALGELLNVVVGVLVRDLPSSAPWSLSPPLAATEPPPATAAWSWFRVEDRLLLGFAGWTI